MITPQNIFPKILPSYHELTPHQISSQSLSLMMFHSPDIQSPKNFGRNSVKGINFLGN